MSRAVVEQAITSIVRDELLLGSERPIPRDKPLGDAGLGLDSLALVNLLTAVEAEFGVDLPDDIWTVRGPLSVADLAEVVARTERSHEPTPPSGRAFAVEHGPMERIELALARRGAAGRAAWAAVRLAAPAARFLLSNRRHVVLERSLDDVSSPQFEAPSGVDIRPYRRGDEARLSGLWATYHEREGRAVLERSLREGAVALVAVEGGRIVALDLISTTGSNDVVVVRPDVSYGFALTEARSVGGRGIGLAVIADSFRVARELGSRAQVTYVWEGNAPMLAATTQLLGFRPLGVARRTRVLGQTRWAWKLDGRQGRGPRLEL